MSSLYLQVRLLEKPEGKDINEAKEIYAVSQFCTWHDKEMAQIVARAAIGTITATVNAFKDAKGFKPLK